MSVVRFHVLLQNIVVQSTSDVIGLNPGFKAFGSSYHG